MTMKPIYILFKLFYPLDHPSFLFVSVWGFFLSVSALMILLSLSIFIYFTFCACSAQTYSYFSSVMPCTLPHHSFHTSTLSLHIHLTRFLLFHFISLLSLSFISSFVHLLVSCFCETHIKSNSRVCFLQPHASVFSSLFHAAQAIIFHSVRNVSLFSLLCSSFNFPLSLVTTLCKIFH